jgi:copper(I)-binding protein
MLVELKQDLNLDDTVSVTLLFEKSDEITVVAKVRQP